jgi:urease gamma subunit
MIAVAYYLIAPHKLHSQSIKLGLGIRDVISNGMGFNHPEVVNHYSRYVIPNFKNARYKERVMQEAEAVLQTVLNQSLKD